MQVSTFHAEGKFQGLTRPETIKSMGLTINQLSHFENLNWVIPERLGNGRNRTVMYSFKNLIKLQFIKVYRRKYSKEIVERVLKFIDENTLDLETWILIDRNDIDEAEMVGWLYPNDVRLNFDISTIQGKEDRQEIRINMDFIPPLKILVKQVFEGVKNSGAMSLEEFKQRLGVDIRAA